jgi:hypothetical protein
MFKSAYAIQAKEFIEEINKSFLTAFEFEPRFTYDDCNPGERYGIISPVDMSPIANQRTVTAGGERWAATFVVLIVLGFEGRIEANAEAFAWMVESDHRIAMAKAIVKSPEFITDMDIVGKVTSVPRQSLKPPNCWVVDISFEVQVKFAIFKDMAGKHVELN